MELLSNYHTMGYLDVYQRMSNGLVTCTQLNASARLLLHDAPVDTWISLSRGEQDGSIHAEWRDENGDFQSRSLEGRVLLMAAVGSSIAAISAEGFDSERSQELTAYASSMQGIPSVVYMDEKTGMEAGSFSWSIKSEPYTIAAYWNPIHGQPQELFSISYSAVPSISTGETEYTPLPKITLGTFHHILNQYGALFVYDKGGREVQHFFYVDEYDQAKPLALCDPVWSSKDLDGDGLDELWSISQDGQFFYLYHLDPAAAEASPAVLSSAL